MIVHYRHGEGAGPEDAPGREAYGITELRGGVCKGHGPRRGMRCAGRTSGSLDFIDLSY